MLTRIWDVTLTVSDLKKAVNFYENILRLQKKYEYNDYAGFDCGGVEIGLKTWGEMEKPRKGEPCVNFSVDNIDMVYSSLKENGVIFVEYPKDAQWGAKIALFADPDGNILQISQIDWQRYFSVNVPK